MQMNQKISFTELINFISMKHSDTPPQTAEEEENGSGKPIDSTRFIRRKFNLFPREWHYTHFISIRETSWCFPLMFVPYRPVSCFFFGGGWFLCCYAEVYSLEPQPQSQLTRSTGLSSFFRFLREKKPLNEVLITWRISTSFISSFGDQFFFGAPTLLLQGPKCFS